MGDQNYGNQPDGNRNPNQEQDRDQRLDQQQNQQGGQQSDREPGGNDRLDQDEDIERGDIDQGDDIERDGDIAR